MIIRKKRFVEQKIFRIKDFSDSPIPESRRVIIMFLLLLNVDRGLPTNAARNVYATTGAHKRRGRNAIVCDLPSFFGITPNSNDFAFLVRRTADKQAIYTAAFRRFNGYFYGR